VRVAFAEVTVGDQVKQAWWDVVFKRRVWPSRYDRVLAFTPNSHNVADPASNHGCPVAAERISMQMRGLHPDRDACIYRWMPASHGG
jgi:hypothetical protein